jgi:hypothetical protein
VASSGAQQPDRDTRLAFGAIRRGGGSAPGNLFTINARLRDSSNRPTDRVHASSAKTQPPPRVRRDGLRVGDPRTAALRSTPRAVGERVV